jgi:hypothetical protein
MLVARLTEESPLMRLPKAINVPVEDTKDTRDVVVPLTDTAVALEGEYYTIYDEILS